jgi:hypothetical protein
MTAKHCYIVFVEKTKKTKKAPSTKTLTKWMMDGVAKAVDGCKVEPDGTCEHGSPSWLLTIFVPTEPYNSGHADTRRRDAAHILRVPWTHCLRVRGTNDRFGAIFVPPGAEGLRSGGHGTKTTLGPWCDTYEKASVLADTPVEREVDIEVSDGDTVEAAGLTWRVTVVKRGWGAELRLTPIL